ncbi:MAG TPA: hypothetical protein VF789_26535 [Thermoanaerobaculia bacterium]
MANVLYQITMGTGLALAIDKNHAQEGGELIVMEPNRADPDQQWTWVFNPATQSSVLYNPGRNLFAAPAVLSQGANIVLCPMSQALSGANTFQVLGATKAAVRPPDNIDLNMNVFGNTWPAGTKVGLWTWDGGASNEVWTSTSV